MFTPSAATITPWAATSTTVQPAARTYAAPRNGMGRSRPGWSSRSTPTNDDDDSDPEQRMDGDPLQDAAPPLAGGAVIDRQWTWSAAWLCGGAVVVNLG